MFKVLGLSLIVGLVVCSDLALGQVATNGQQRIPQPIIINGQQEQGVMVVQNGAVQTFTCPSPQQYVTADQSSSGWACFEQTTGMWLLHAQPPQRAYSYQQPQVYGTAPAVPVYSYPYSDYPYYGYYPYYSYDPFFIGPPYGFGFGFGFRSPFFVGRPVVINRPVVFRGPIGINRPVGAGFGRSAGTFASRPSGGFRSAGGGRAFGSGRRR